MSTGYRNRPHIAQKDPAIAEALDDLLGRINAMAAQTNSNPTGPAPQPPAVGAVNVTAANGIVHAQITDGSPVTRGIAYHFESSVTPDFKQPTLLQSGPSRDYRGALGSQPVYIRAYSQYGTGKPSTPVYHGTPGTPALVRPGGAAGPEYPPSKGSGTPPTNGTLGGAGFGHVQAR